MTHFLDYLADRVVLCDGAMGTQVQARNLDIERDFFGLENCTEILCDSRPDLIREIHRGYLEAGCDVLQTNSFGGSPVTLGEFGIADRTFELNRRAAELAPQDPAPMIAAGDVLLQMGNINEAIVSYNAALVRPGDTQGAQVGLAKAFLKTGKPQLALSPLSKAMAQSPDDPKLLLLLGVTKDLAGEHGEAQAYYRDGLVRAPGDPGLTVNLALSLALSGNYPNAIAVLQPLAMSPAGSAQERQTLALIYGLRGNTAEAARLSRIDLDDASVEHNLAYYATLRELSPEARSRAILTPSGPTAS